MLIQKDSDRGMKPLSARRTVSSPRSCLSAPVLVERSATTNGTPGPAGVLMKLRCKPLLPLQSAGAIERASPFKSGSSEPGCNPVMPLQTTAPFKGSSAV